MADPIRIGIIGCGYWGANYVRVFTELPGATVVAASDLSADRLDAVKERFPAVSLVQRWQEVIDSPHIDAVVISTPATTHYAIARACVLAGRAALVEKPMTTDVEQAKELAALAAQRGTVLMIGHTFLYNAGIRRLKECMESEEFGRVYYLHATRTNLGPIRRDVNALWDLAPHDVSIFNHFLDAVPDWVSAVGASVLGNGREDVGFVDVHYPGGVLGNIHVSWADPSKVRRIVVVGSNRRLTFDDMDVGEPVRIFEKGVTAEAVDAGSFHEYRLMMLDGDIISPKIQPSEPLKNQCAHFLDCARNGEIPLTGAGNGLDVVRVMAAIEESLARNGAPVDVS